MNAVELQAWQRRCGLRRDADAAAVLGISIPTYRRKRTGRTRITRQTEMLAGYYELRQTLDPVRLAELSELIGRMIRLSVRSR